MSEHVRSPSILSPPGQDRVEENVLFISLPVAVVSVCLRCYSPLQYAKLLFSITKCTLNIKGTVATVVRGERRSLILF